jgi:hypothetical protein
MGVMPAQPEFLVLRETIFIDRGSSQVMSLAYGAAYHTSQTMNQHISRGAEHFAGHSERKADFLTHLEGAIELKGDAAGGYVPGHCCQLGVVGGEDGRKDEWKPDCTTDFLRHSGRR